MLNKELMLTTSRKEVRPVYLSVGILRNNETNDIYYGYSKADRYGEVNTRPFWNTPEGNIVLDGLYYCTRNDYTYLVSESKVDSYVPLNIEISGWTADMNLYGNNISIKKRDVFDLMNTIDNPVLVIFNPPPDGYINP